METVTHRFHGFDALIDGARELFEQWKREEVFSPPLDTNGLERAKLAVHEWLANLVQHADFQGREPEVVLTVSVEQDRLRCVIIDNSEGFDIGPHLSAKQDILRTFPERGMGIMLLRCSTSELSYRRLADGRHRLEFFVESE